MAGNWTKDSVAGLQTVDAAALDRGQDAEKQKLMQAAQLTGLFNLWLGSTADGKAMLDLLSDIYRISDSCFAQSAQVKEQDARTDQKPNQDRGYESSDCDETFEEGPRVEARHCIAATNRLVIQVSYDEFKQGTIKLPSSLQKDQAKLEEFSLLCHRVCEDVLRSISDGLGMLKEKLLLDHHQGTTNSGLKLISEPVLVKLGGMGDNTHTDGGTLTMIFHR